MLKALKPYLQSMLAQREMTFWSDRAKRARKMDLPTLRDEDFADVCKDQQASDKPAA